MVDRANCSKWIVETARRCAFASPRVVRSPANTTLSSPLPTRLASRSSCLQLFYVLARLQIARLAPSPPLGRRISLASLHAHVCPQLLGRPRRRRRSPL